MQFRLLSWPTWALQLLFLLSVVFVAAAGGETEGHHAEDAFRFEELVEWVTEAGGFFATSLAELREIDGWAGRGMVAKADMEEGTILMEVPSTVMFTEQAAMATLQISSLPFATSHHCHQYREKSNEKEQGHSNDTVASSDDQSLVMDCWEEEEAVEHLMEMPLTNAMAILLLSHLGMGARSPFAPFLRSLPSSAAPSTLHYTPQDLLYLEGSTLRDLSLQREASVEAFWARLPSPWRLFPLPRFRWALGMLWSRTISVWLSGDRSEGALVPLADLFNAGLSSPLGSRFVQCSAAPSLICLQYFVRSFILKDTHMVTAYGTVSRLSNAELLFFYGLVLPSNPHDSARLRVDCDPSDPLYSRKRLLLKEARLDAPHFQVPLSPSEVPAQLLLLAQLCSLRPHQLGSWTHWLSANSPSLLRRAHEHLLALVDGHLAIYPSPLPDDQALLSRLQALASPSRDQLNHANALVVTIGERLILHQLRHLTLDFLQQPPQTG